MTLHFASDNNAGVHPEVLAAIERANAGHVPSYGADAVTARAELLFREVLGDEARVFFVMNGTAANVLSLKHVTAPHEGIVCADTAHIQVDECGALEAVTGRKLLVATATDGKLSPQSIEPWLADRGDVHRVQPRIVSISQATEYGTVYSVDELRALCTAAREAGLLVHMDGARIANAAAHLGVELREVTAGVGIDVLSFGGTKNGLLHGEAVVFFGDALAENFPFLRKQLLQLSSKSRFVAAQFEALLAGDLWRRNATHANAMAALLAEEATSMEGLTLTRPVQTNAVFARMSAEAITRLQSRARFLVWNQTTSEVRWMTAFDTSEHDVRRFAEAIRQALQASRS